MQWEVHARMWHEIPTPCVLSSIRMDLAAVSTGTTSRRACDVEHHPPLSLVWSCLQERAIRIAMEGDGASEEALAAATADLASDAAVPRETLLEFARKFADRAQHSAAVHAYLAAGCPGDALDVVEQHGVRCPPHVHENKTGNLKLMAFRVEHGPRIKTPEIMAGSNTHASCALFASCLAGVGCRQAGACHLKCPWQPGVVRVASGPHRLPVTLPTTQCS